MKNIYNHYVYFWRWALWKVFESASHVEQGLISFITPSSYLDGDAFAGMREHLRQHCSSLWILDLGGEGRGTRKDDNVFPTVQSPVAVAIALRDNNTDLDNPAPVYYTRLEGERTAKLAYLDNIQTLQDVDWQLCCADWQAPFRPAFHDAYFDLPLLADLMPWSGRGIQFSRTWVVSEDKNCLEQRWQTLLRAKKTDKKHLICETVDVEIEKTYLSFFNEERLPSIESLTNEQPEKIEHIMYRSFDRQWCIADRRVIDRPRPALWRCRSEQQIYFATLVNDPLTQGPALAVSFTVPDLNMFNNRGGLVYPLYRTADADKANILPGLLDILAATYQTSVTADDFAAYLYATLAHPEFTRHFKRELDTRELRVPITQNAALFKHMRDIGANLLWLHTYGTRWVTKDRPRGLIPSKQARCLKAVQSEHEEYPEQFGYDPATQQLHVGAGIFAPVTPDIYQFEISGLKVLQSWLRYRMKAGAGKKSSKLNDIRPQIWRSQFTTELLELLWVLEATVADYPKQAEVFQAIVQGDCLKRQDLPDVPEYMRSAYKADKNGNLI